jgi:hypothetical protein
MEAVEAAAALALANADTQAMEAAQAEAEAAEALALVSADIQLMDAAQAAVQVPLAGPEVAAIETAEAPSTVRPLGALRKSARKPVSSAIHKGL